MVSKHRDGASRQSAGSQYVQDGMDGVWRKWSRASGVLGDRLRPHCDLGPCTL